MRGQLFEALGPYLPFLEEAEAREQRCRKLIRHATGIILGDRPALLRQVLIEIDEAPSLSARLRKHHDELDGHVFSEDTLEALGLITRGIETLGLLDS